MKLMTTHNISYHSILASRIISAFKTLLETKHLYQGLYVDSNLSEDEIKSLDKGFSNSNSRVAVIQIFSQLFVGNWVLADPLLPDDKLNSYIVNNVIFRPPDIKVYCIRCGRIEAFNLRTCVDILTRGKPLTELTQEKQSTVQIFSFSYICQSCKIIPEIFIIRRDGAKLTLSGRTPMEYVDVPKTIPKSVNKYFSGAMVAHQSGQTLAANFLLRTLIEQYARTKSLDPQSADDAIDQYMNTLPEDFKARFPSFRELYGILSADIHSAVGSPDIFDDVVNKIVKHFEAIALFDS